MGKTLILKPLIGYLNTISFMLIIFTFQLILWLCHRSEVTVDIPFGTLQQYAKEEKTKHKRVGAPCG
jgi:hypothetical protein